MHFQNDTGLTKIKTIDYLNAEIGGKRGVLLRYMQINMQMNR